MPKANPRNSTEAPSTAADDSDPSSTENLIEVAGLLARAMELLAPSASRPGVASRPRRPSPEAGLSVTALCWKYLDHAESYYRWKTDTGTCNETTNLELALRPLRKLYGKLPAGEFSPRKLKAVRDAMVEKGWCRRQVNKQVGRVKRMFKWAEEEELVAPQVFHGLNAVAGLRYGRSKARESEPVKPVGDELVQGVLAVATVPVKAMIELQRVTGMRPGEVVIMRTCDIDRTTQPWLYRPTRHKTAHYGHERLVFLGPKCQEILAPFLRLDAPERFLFSPKDSDRERRALLTAARRTPLSCGNRAGKNVKKSPKKLPRERYDTNSYSGSISYACKRAFPAPEGSTELQRHEWDRRHHWHPHQLRHTAATRLRKEFGLDVAQVVLGHQTLAVTQVYAERDVGSAQKVMLMAG